MINLTTFSQITAARNYVSFKGNESTSNKNNINIEWINNRNVKVTVEAILAADGKPCSLSMSKYKDVLNYFGVERISNKRGKGDHAIYRNNAFFSNEKDEETNPKNNCNKYWFTISNPDDKVASDTMIQALQHSLQIVNQTNGELMQVSGADEEDIKNFIEITKVYNPENNKNQYRKYFEQHKAEQKAKEEAAQEQARKNFEAQQKAAEGIKYTQEKQNLKIEQANLRQRKENIEKKIETIETQLKDYINDLNFMRDIVEEIEKQSSYNKDVIEIGHKYINDYENTITESKEFKQVTRKIKKLKNQLDEIKPSECNSEDIKEANKILNETETTINGEITDKFNEICKKAKALEEDYRRTRLEVTLDVIYAETTSKMSETFLNRYKYNNNKKRNSTTHTEEEVAEKSTVKDNTVVETPVEEITPVVNETEINIETTGFPECIIPVTEESPVVNETEETAESTEETPGEEVEAVEETPVENNTPVETPVVNETEEVTEIQLTTEELKQYQDRLNNKKIENITKIKNIGKLFKKLDTIQGNISFILENYKKQYEIHFPQKLNKIYEYLKDVETTKQSDEYKAAKEASERIVQQLYDIDANKSSLSEINDENEKLSVIEDEIKKIANSCKNIHRLVNNDMRLKGFLKTYNSMYDILTKAEEETQVENNTPVETPVVNKTKETAETTEAPTGAIPPTEEPQVETPVINETEETAETTEETPAKEVETVEETTLQTQLTDVELKFENMFKLFVQGIVSGKINGITGNETINEDVNRIIAKYITYDDIKNIAEGFNDVIDINKPINKEKIANSLKQPFMSKIKNAPEYIRIRNAVMITAYDSLNREIGYKQDMLFNTPFQGLKNLVLSENITFNNETFTQMYCENKEQISNSDAEKIKKFILKIYPELSENKDLDDAIKMQGNYLLKLDSTENVSMKLKGKIFELLFNQLDKDNAAEMADQAINNLKEYIHKQEEYTNKLNMLNNAVFKW